MMNTRLLKLISLYIRSTFAISFPAKAEWKKPKVLFKWIGIAVLTLLVIADFSFIFIMMNLSLYDGLKPVGMQSMMLLNAATTSAVLVFVFAFLMALSMFSMAGIESSFLVLPFSARQLFAAKIALVYVSEVILGAFMLLVAMVIYSIKESPPLMFYVNGLITAFALPLLPTAIAYAILVPLMNTSKKFRNKNFILYVGGFMGMGFALLFNLYLQRSMANVSNPAQLALMTGPDSFISKFGQAWIPSWLAWVSMRRSDSLTGFLAVLGNLAIGAVAVAAVIALFGKAYVRSIQDFSETTIRKRRLSRKEHDSLFRASPLMLSLIRREFRLMNREPMYLLNGPFVILLMPAIFAIVFIAQKDALREVTGVLAPMLQGPAGYLVPAGFGAFLGSSTSIACTSVSRDAKTIPFIRSLPITPSSYFLAKFAHAETFSVLGALFGCLSGLYLLKNGLADTMLAFALALLFTTAVNIYGLWLDTANPRLRWDNPIAALKQNPNSIIVILLVMGLVGGLGYLSSILKLARIGYFLVYGGILLALDIAGAVFFGRYAGRRMEYLE